MTRTPRTRQDYAIPYWSDGYFSISEDGFVTAHPRGPEAPDNINLHQLACALKQEGLTFPVLVRFTDILENRAEKLRMAFARARQQYEYSGRYKPVYPIKVNQQRQVLEGILKSGKLPNELMGLEAGSKPELLAILGLADQRTVICNGYKDRTYIRLALIGMRLGMDITIVIEKPSELELILAEAQALQVTPRLGVRIRLSSISAGKWQNSGGEKSKFGLNASSLLQLVNRLESAGRLDCLHLLHFHMGSQIANIRDVQTALREAARYFCELHALGSNITTIDVGGGLGVDYEGTRSRSFSSINYSLDEYAQNIIRAFAEVCSDNDLPHPHVITEAGRAMTAHHAVLVTNVTEIEMPEPPAGNGLPVAGMETDCPPLQNLLSILDGIDRRPVLETDHDTQFDLSEIRALYVQGQLSLDQLATAEQLATRISLALRDRLDLRIRSHRDLNDELTERLADKIFCNFSLFQSMPDAWAIDQVFPVMPLQRLNEAPDRQAVLQDLTCDSDGRIKQYVHHQGIETTLSVHQPQPGEDYLIGFFLVGAYQEILGDMHNLFGDTHSVNIEVTTKGGYRMVDPNRGEDVADLLEYVHIRPHDLERAFQKRLAQSDLSPALRKQFANELISGLSAYTYLED